MTCVLLHHDCRLIDAAAVGHDMLHSDPPYSEHVHSNMTSCAQKGDRKGVRHRDAGFDHLSDSLSEYVGAAARAAKRWSAIYTDIQSAGDWRDRMGGDRKRGGSGLVRAVPTFAGEFGELGDCDAIGTLPWVRWSMAQQSGDRPPSACELVVLGHTPGKVWWRGPGNLMALTHKCMRGDQKHPTQKPLDQALDLISWLTEPGDLVYEPCAGVGTTGVACALLGRNYFGLEHFGDSADPEVQARSAHHAATGAERIQQALEGRLPYWDDHTRFRRWVASVLARSERSDFDAKVIVHDHSEPLQLPEAYRWLINGKLVGEGALPRNYPATPSP